MKKFQAITNYACSTHGWTLQITALTTNSFVQLRGATKRLQMLAIYATVSEQVLITKDNEFPPFRVLEMMRWQIFATVLLLCSCDVWYIIGLLYM